MCCCSLADVICVMWLKSYTIPNSCAWMTVKSLIIQRTHLHSLLCPRAGVVGHLDPVRSTPGRPSAVIAQDLKYLLAWFTRRGLAGPNQRQQPAMDACMVLRYSLYMHTINYQCIYVYHIIALAYNCNSIKKEHLATYIAILTTLVCNNSWDLALYTCLDQWDFMPLDTHHKMSAWTSSPQVTASIICNAKCCKYCIVSIVIYNSSRHLHL